MPNKFKFAQKLLIGSIILFIPLIIFCILRQQASNKFYKGCRSHIEEAKKLNDLDLSISELDKAIDFLEKEKLTNGYTSVFDPDSDDNLERLYRDLKKSRHLLSSRELMSEKNLKEFLKDNAYYRIEFPISQGIEIYPYNKLYFIFAIISAFMAFLGVVGMFHFVEIKS